MAALGFAAFLRTDRRDATVSARERPDARDARDDSKEVPGAGALEAASVPAVYRLTYRVQDWAAGRLVETTDTITVERPYRGLVEVRLASAERSAPPRSRTTTDFGRISIEGADADAIRVATPPSLAIGDLRFDAMLGDAVAAGRMSLREQREVRGQRCQVYRTREPVAAGTLSASAATTRDYTDSCLRSDGILLEELWVTDGRVLRRRVATSIDTSPQIADDTFAAFGEMLDPKEGGGSIRPVAADTTPAGATFWQGLSVPPDFAFRGRYAVVPPRRDDTQEEDARSQPLEAPAGKRVGAVVDVWERGIDLLLLEQGGSVDGTSVFALESGEPTFAVDGLGTAQVVLDGRLGELRFPLASGRYVRVLGTLPLDALRTAARSLQPAPEGTGLVYLDDAPR